MVDVEPAIVCEKMVDGICIGTAPNYLFEYAVIISIIIGIGMGSFFLIQKRKKTMQ